MIVDTSALIAIMKRETGFDALLRACVDEGGMVPAPVLAEFERVVSGRADIDAEGARATLAWLLARAPLRVLPFDEVHARVAAQANARHGTGNGRGGTLNLLDLMVYACAQVEGRPVLCTGRDFAATDAALHPASRAS